MLAAGAEGERQDGERKGPLAQFAAKRSRLVNKADRAGLTEMREDVSYLTIAGQHTVREKSLIASFSRKHECAVA
jgi:hypothetical protein